MSRRSILANCTRCCSRGYPQPPLRCWLLGHADLLHLGWRDVNYCWARRAIHKLSYLYHLPINPCPTLSVDTLMNSPSMRSAVENEVNSEISSEDDGSLRVLLWRRAESVLTRFSATMKVPLLRSTLYLSLVLAGVTTMNGTRCRRSSVRVNLSQLAALSHVTRVSPGTPLLLVSATAISPLCTLLLVLALLSCGVSVPLRVLVVDPSSTPLSLTERLIVWLLRQVGVTLCPGRDPVTAAAAENVMMSSLSSGQHWLLSIDSCGSQLKTLISQHVDGRISDAFIVPVSISDSLAALRSDCEAVSVRFVVAAVFRYLITGNSQSCGAACVELGEPMRLSEFAGRSDAATRLQRHLVFSSGACTAIHCSQIVALLLVYRFTDGCSFAQLCFSLGQLLGDLQQRGACLAERVSSGDGRSNWSTVTRRALKSLSGLVVEVKEGADDTEFRFAPGSGPHCRRRLAKHAAPCLSWLMFDALAVRSVSLLVPSFAAVLHGLDIEVASTISRSSLLDLCTVLLEMLGPRWRSGLAPPCRPDDESLSEAVLGLQRLGVLVHSSDSGGSRPVTESELWAGRAFARLQVDHLSDGEGERAETLWSVHVPEGGLDRLSLLLAVSAPHLETLCVTTTCLSDLLLDGGVCERRHFVERVMETASEKMAAGTIMYGYYCCSETINDALETLLEWGVVDVSCRSGVSVLSLQKGYCDEVSLNRLIQHVHSVI